MTSYLTSWAEIIPICLPIESSKLVFWGLNPLIVFYFESCILDDLVWKISDEIQKKKAHPCLLKYISIYKRYRKHRGNRGEAIHSHTGICTMWFPLYDVQVPAKLLHVVGHSIASAVAGRELSECLYFSVSEPESLFARVCSVCENSRGCISEAYTCV